MKFNIQEFKLYSTQTETKYRHCLSKVASTVFLQGLFGRLKIDGNLPYPDNIN
jgi:hypothetical protein